MKKQVSKANNSVSKQKLKYCIVVNYTIYNGPTKLQFPFATQRLTAVTVNQ